MKIMYFLPALTLFYSLVPVSLQASEPLMIFDGPSKTRDKPNGVEVHFVVNQVPPRAWVEIGITGDEVDADHEHEHIVIKSKIPGLEFDPKSSQVLYKASPNAPFINCGTFIEGGFMRSSQVEPTGHCKFTSSVEVRPVEEGFEVRNGYFIRITLETSGTGPGELTK
jgi:hypothetical protein